LFDPRRIGTIPRMSQLRFRRAIPSDAAVLAAFMARTFRDTYDNGDFDAADIDTYMAEKFGPDQQRDEIEDATLTTILGEVDGALAAYVQVRHDSTVPVISGSRPIEIMRFYVDRSWHGRGLAASMMREAIAVARDADPLWLIAYARNHRALAFYQKMGFVVVGTHPFTMGTDTQNDSVLVRQVPSSQDR
jgi:ribosomal protein S18 acetylase RimI-like enzyme